MCTTDPSHDFMSIVMLNFNGRTYLEQTVPVILKKPCDRFELIVVDNGSTDGSVEFLRTFPQIRLVALPENRGYSIGKNIGASHAKGPLLLLLDNDVRMDRVEIGKLARRYQSQTIVSLPSYDSGSNMVSNHGSFISRLQPLQNPTPISQLKFEGGEHTYDVAGITGRITLMRLSVWNDLGGYDQAQPFNLDDYDLSMRAWLKGYRCQFWTGSEFLVEHLGQDERIRTDRWCWKYQYHFSGIARAILKNVSLRNVFVMLIAFFSHECAKTILQFLKRRSLCVVVSFGTSVLRFIRFLPDTLRLRRVIQKERKVRDDVFLSIKRPQFLQP